MKTIVVSDLHLGPDNIIPIYAGSEQLPALLHNQMDSLGRVVLNGDTFDLLLDEEPLELDAELAASRVRVCAESSDGAGLIAVLSELLTRGGEVVVRAGNHDLELALPGVQDALAASFRRAGASTTRLHFAQEDEPLHFSDGGVRVLVTHGENTDPFNRWTREALQATDFEFPPGSKLVKEVLNPLKGALRFVDLLKPDFQGAVLTALAVRPREVKSLLKLSVLDIIASAVEASFSGSPFPTGASESIFAGPLANANLADDEGDALLSYLEEAESFGRTDGELSLLERALAKLGRSALSAYATAHRWVAGTSGERYFDETPTDDEWEEAERLARTYSVDAVITGHTHARRYGARGSLTYANTGTWIALLGLPAHTAPVAEWTAFLSELRSDPQLIESTRVRVVGTACVVDPSASLQVSLVGETRPPPAAWYQRSSRIGH